MRIELALSIIVFLLVSRCTESPEESARRQYVLDSLKQDSIEKAEYESRIAESEAWDLEMERRRHEREKEWAEKRANFPQTPLIHPDYITGNFLDGAKSSYPLTHLQDGIDTTWWTPQNPRSGKGAQLVLNFDAQESASGLVIQNLNYLDHPKYGDLFDKNNRIRRASATILYQNGDSAKVSFEVGDRPRPNYLPLKPGTILTIYLTIDDIYPGSEWNDLAVAGIALFPASISQNSPTRFQEELDLFYEEGTSLILSQNVIDIGNGYTFETQVEFQNVVKGERDYMGEFNPKEVHSIGIQFKKGDKSIQSLHRTNEELGYGNNVFAGVTYVGEFQGTHLFLTKSFVGGTDAPPTNHIWLFREGGRAEVKDFSYDHNDSLEKQVLLDRYLVDGPVFHDLKTFQSTHFANNIYANEQFFDFIILDEEYVAIGSGSGFESGHIDIHRAPDFHHITTIPCACWTEGLGYSIYHEPPNIWTTEWTFKSEQSDYYWTYSPGDKPKKHGPGID